MAWKTTSSVVESSRASRAGRYQSVTVMVTARDRAHLDALYQELSGHPQIRMVL
mgnify:CR=1 FL=1